MGIQDIFKDIGEALSGVTQKVLELIPVEFLSSVTTAKIVSILVPLLVILGILKFGNLLSKPIKWVIVVLLVLLILSVAFTLGA